MKRYASACDLFYDTPLTLRLNVKCRWRLRRKFESRDDEELCASAFFSYRTPFPAERGGRGDRETNDTTVSLFV